MHNIKFNDEWVGSISKEDFLAHINEHKGHYKMNEVDGEGYWNKVQAEKKAALDEQKKS